LGRDAPVRGRGERSGFAAGTLNSPWNAMCNLYSITRSQDAIRQLFAVTRDLSGNLPPLPSVFPDQMAPVVRQDGADRDDALGDAGANSVWRYAGHEYSQYQEPALAALAWTGQSLPGAGDVVLRICRH
jgi:hypothetical protein